VILLLCTESLAAAHKGHSRARHFGAIFTFLVQIFFACSAQHIIFTQCFIWEVGIAAASMEARVMRVLPSNAFASPTGTVLLGISAASGSFGSAGAEHSKAHVERRAALIVAALAAICSAFRLLVCRCTVHYWPLCMDRARHFCVWLCSVWWLVLIGDCYHLSVCLCPG
jgi:hypothetical protein